MSSNQFPAEPLPPRRLVSAGDYHGPDRRRALAPEAPQRLSTTLVREDEDELDLLAYWQALMRRRWVVLGSVALLLAGAFVMTLLTPPMYRATATLKVDPYSMQVMQVQGITPTPRMYDPKFAQTEFELLQSRSLARRVAEDLQLAGTDIFERLRPPGWIERARQLFRPQDTRAAQGALPLEQAPAGELLAGQNAADAVAPPVETTDATASAARDAELERMTNLVHAGLLVTPVRGTHLVDVSYSSTLPEFSARVANAVAAGFIAASLDLQFGDSSYARKYLEDQLDLTKGRLEDSERALVAYSQENDLVLSSQGSSLVGENLSELNASLAGAQADRIRAQARWELARDSRGGALPADMLKDSILHTLQEQKATLQRQYQQDLGTFKPQYPSMVALQSQIDEVQHQIDAELARIRASVEAEFQSAQAREAMLTRQLTELRTETLAIAERSIQYNILKRDVETNRDLYQDLMQRFKQISVAASAKTSNISVVDPALVPRGRYSPSMSRNLSMGLLLGLFLGVGLALLLEFLDNTIKTPHDVEELLRLGVLGIIPRLRKMTPEEASANLRSAFSESYRSARTALQFSTEQGVPRALLITSAASGEGKSTSAVTLARNFAQLGKRVLLIEADMRNPGLAEMLHLPATAGLAGVLTGAAKLKDVISPVDDGQLHVLLAGPAPPTPAELLSGNKMVSLLTVAGNNYDQIIIDGPPVLGLADALLLGSLATGTLLVVCSGSTRIQAAQAAIKRLQAARTRLVGCLLTMYDAKQQGRDYDYAGYYGYEGGHERLSAS